MSEVPPPTDIAAEIHRNFERKMAPGGEIDRILNGGQPIEKRSLASEEEIALTRRQIDLQMAEYETAITSAVAWHRDWKVRRPRGFRAKRRRET